MSRHFKIILIVTILSSIGTAQWVQINGPGPTSVNAFAKDGGTLLAGTDGNGVHASTDGGITWKSINGVAPGAVLQNVRIMSLFVDGSRMYAGSFAAGMYYSTNQGASWTKYGSPISNSSINAIIKLDTVLLAGGAGMFRSTNNGTSWSSSATGLTNTNVRGMAINGSTIFAVTDGGIFLSTNHGANWSAANNGIVSANKYGIGIASTNGVLYALVSNGFSGGHVIFKSTNNGAQWDTSNGNLSSLSTKCIAANGSTVFVGLNNNQTVRSTNGGTSWTTLTGGAQNPATIFLDGSHVFVGGTNANFAGNGGVFRSTNNGDTWVRTTPEMLTGTVTTFGLLGEKLLAGLDGGSHNNTVNGVWTSTDHGRTWTRTNTGLMGSGNPLRLSHMTIVGTRIFGHAWSNVPWGVFMSSDSGASWSEANTGLPQFSTVTGFLSYADTVYAVAGNLYRSTNFGQSWELWRNNLPNGGVVGLTRKGDTLFVARGSDYNIYRSEDGGRTWETKPTNLPTSTFSSPGKLYTDGVRLFTIAASMRVFWCADSGRTWTETSGVTFSGDRGATHLAIHNNNVFVVTQSSGIYVSTNNLETWTAMNQGIAESFPSFSTAIVAWNNVYAALGGKVMRRNLAEFGINKVEEIPTHSLPSEFHLMQNYPNPFNPSTTIEFAIVQESFVTLRVFNILGQEVAQLVREPMHAGTYRVQWNATALPSGVYFSVLEAGGKRIAKRMTLVK